MPSNTSKSSTDQGLNLVLLNIPHSILLQLSTGSMLLALLAGKATVEALQAISEGSEEIFRGDRLPILQFPVETESESS